MMADTLRLTADLEEEPESADPTPQRGVRRWVVQHDDSWWFVGCYLGLAVVLSLAISLFWLVAVVAAHGVLEWHRQRWLSPGTLAQAWVRVIWELKLDLALVLFALALAVYLDTVLGVAGLGGAARLGAHAGARLGTRTTVWSRALRSLLLSLDDAAQLGRAVAGRRAPDPSRDSEDVPAAPQAPWRSPWRWSDHLPLWGGMALLLLLLVAPWCTHHNAASMLSLLGEELHPFPWWMDKPPGPP